MVKNNWKDKWYIKIYSKENGEGKYWDFWTANHILGGAVLAGIFFLLNIEFWASLITSLLIIILWEIFEVVQKIHEHAENRMVDVITGLFGYFTMHYIIKCQLLEPTTLFLIILSLCIILNIWGRISYTIRSKKS
ncbi:MAG: hypothetical protein ABII97_02630 [Patescibacteria group bacterium]